MTSHCPAYNSAQRLERKLRRDQWSLFVRPCAPTRECTPLVLPEPAVATEMPAEQVRQHVEEILRPQCAHLSQTEFEDLVNSVVGSRVARAIVRSTPKRGVLAPVDLPEYPLPIPSEGIEITAEQA